MWRLSEAKPLNFSSLPDHMSLEDIADWDAFSDIQLQRIARARGGPRYDLLIMEAMEATRMMRQEREEDAEDERRIAEAEELDGTLVDSSSELRFDLDCAAAKIQRYYRQRIMKHNKPYRRAFKRTCSCCGYISAGAKLCKCSRCGQRLCCEACNKIHIRGQFGGPSPSCFPPYPSGQLSLKYMGQQELAATR